MTLHRSHSPDTNSLHILVVEDHEDGRAALRMLLSALGHRVEVAADGVEGLRKAQEGNPDVAILDIGLPCLDGFEVGRRLRASRGGSVRLIAHTAYRRDDLGGQSAEGVFDDWLVKPVGLEELQQSLGGKAPDGGGPTWEPGADLHLSAA
jgi:CheY-like chemotaxis protein